MTDTIDRLVRILDEEREAHHRTREERASANYTLMNERAAHKLTQSHRQDAHKDLEIAEDKIKEWTEYAAKLRDMLTQRKVLSEKLPRQPAQYYRSDIPF